jgi:hypothetical protein
LRRTLISCGVPSKVGIYDITSQLFAAGRCWQRLAASGLRAPLRYRRSYRVYTRSAGRAGQLKLRLLDKQGRKEGKEIPPSLRMRSSQEYSRKDVRQPEAWYAVQFPGLPLQGVSPCVRGTLAQVARLRLRENDSCLRVIGVKPQRSLRIRARVGHLSEQ